MLGITQIEKRGIPGVLFVAQSFVRDAQASARAFGLNDVALAVMPTPGTNKPEDTLRQMAADAIEQVITGLTRPVARKIGAAAAKPSEILSYGGGDLLDALEAMNRAYLAEGWSDGLPLVPATQPAVAKMLAGTALPRDHAIGLLEPGFGIATIEKLAINAVMAGCRPEHFPVLITSVQCFCDAKAMMRSVAVSTAPNAPLALINGPIAKEININSKCCALGPGAASYANTVIGRALRLILMNVGYCYPGSGDMDTIGSPTKYGMCVAENEEDSPWPAFHTERGFDRNQSTVTIHWNYGLVDVLDFWSTSAEGVIEKYSRLPGAREGGAFTWLGGHHVDANTRVTVREHNMILMGPEHARLFARQGWDKNRVREELHKRARIPFGVFNSDPIKFKAAHPELLWMMDHPDLPVPVLEAPECYEIAVVGADVGRGIFIWGKHEPVIRAIDPAIMPAR
ncbi:MAG: hypothetical protein EXR28_14665 [Betaproteobacteria bacterium]|nr:hypothetical protein [Betaproteobacteria bacterium]